MTATVPPPGHLAAGRGPGRARPRRARAFRADDLAELAASAVAALALTWLLFYRLTPLWGALGFAASSYVAFVATYWLVTRDRHGPVVAADRLATVVVSTLAAALAAPVVAVVLTVVARGAGSISSGFFTETLAEVGPLAAATEGGALHAIVGTLQQVGIAFVLAVPLGILAAVYLNEIGGRLARWVRTVAEALTALPSIVAGLFVYSLWVLRFGRGFAGVAGSLALAILMLPTVVVTAEQVLRVVPGGLREAAFALGAPQWRSVLLVVLPTARAGLVTTAVLAVARVVGETAPLLLTAFGARTLNTNPLSGAQDNLPLFIWSQARSAQPNAVDRGWAGAVVLFGLVVLLFSLARLAGRARLSRRRRYRAPIAPTTLPNAKA